MKIITMYELLGMVKDGKAPKRIKYDGMIWKFVEDNLYFSDNVWLDEYCNISQILNDEVEILEEEKKIPEKINYNEINKNLNQGTSNDLYLATTINFIIDYLKSKGDE